MANDKQLKVYLYRGKNRSGKKVTGSVNATNLDAAKGLIRQLGVATNNVKKKSTTLTFSPTEKKIKPAEIAVLSRQLATMIRAGLPLIKAFEVAAESTTKAPIKELVMSLHVDVSSGGTFSEALAKHPTLFDELYCNLIAAGELSGTLDIMLERVSTFQEKALLLKAKIKKALTYPISVLVIAGVVTAVMLIKVVPSFQQSFASFGAELPAFTLAVIALSEIVQDSWLWMLGLIIVTVIAFKQATARSEAFVYLLNRYSLKVPVVGNIIFLGAIARFARTLSTTFASGIPMINALEASAGATGNLYIADAVTDLTLAVTQGTQLNVAMAKNSLFPPLLTQLTKVGEEAGDLESMIDKAAETYENEVNDAVDNMTTLIEPIIMSFLAVVVGGLMIAMYLPIFAIGSAI
jgi:type IV pilus assembly protein PilC|tara:strand:+ start:2535 stop:3755 length:1221 start_codon:yes stop_codon:yes gene_type:complete